MSTITLIVVLVAIALAFLLGKHFAGEERTSSKEKVGANREQDGSDRLSLTQMNRISEALRREGEAEVAARIAGSPVERPHPGEDPAILARLQAEDADWAARIKAKFDSRSPDSGPPAFSDEEAARFRTFTAIKTAVRIAQAAGRPGSRFTPVDLLQANEECQKKMADALVLAPQLTEAQEKWSEACARTGILKGPEGDRAMALSQQLEDLAFDAGDFNTFAWALCWRLTKLGVAKKEPGAPAS